MANPKGIKVIRHLPSKIDIADDPALPFKVEISLRSPEFMRFAFMMLYGGSEEIIARGETRESIDQFLVDSGLCNHTRLQRIRLTGPDGSVEDIDGRAIQRATGRG